MIFDGTENKFQRDKIPRKKHMLIDNIEDFLGYDIYENHNNDFFGY